MHQIRVNRSQLILLAILIYGFLGIYFRMEQEFWIIGMIISIAINFLLVGIYYKWPEDQRTYIFYGSLIFLTLYLLDWFYFQLGWNWYLALIYGALMGIQIFTLRDNLAWEGKIIRDLTFLILLISNSLDPWHFGILFGIILVIIFGEEQLQHKLNAQPEQYDINRYTQLAVDWSVLLGYGIYHYLRYDSILSLILVVISLYIVYLKLGFVNPTGEYLTGWLASTPVFIIILMIYYARNPILGNFLLITGLYAGWMLIEFLIEFRHREYINYDRFRIIKALIFAIWIIPVPLIASFNAGTVIFVDIGLCIGWFFFERNRTVRALYLITLNLLLVIVLLPVFLRTFPGITWILLQISSEEFRLLVIFGMEIVLIGIFFLISVTRFIEISDNVKAIFLIANKFVLLCFALVYIWTYSQESPIVYQYLLNQLEISIIIMVVSTIAIFKVIKLRLIGFFLAIYSMLTMSGISIIYWIRFQDPPPNVFLWIYLITVFCLVLVVNLRIPIKSSSLGLKFQEVNNLVFTGIGLILTCLIFKSNVISFTMGASLCGEFIILRIIQKDTRLNIIYTLIAQVIWYFLLISTYLTYELEILFATALIGLILFLISDIFNQSHLHILGLLLWAPIGAIFVLVFSGILILASFSSLNAIFVPIIGIGLWTGYLTIEIKIRGGLRLNKWIWQGALLVGIPIAALGFYLALENLWLVIPSSIPYLPILIYGLLGIVEVGLGILFIRTAPPKTLTKLVSQRIEKAEKSQKK